MEPPTSFHQLEDFLVLLAHAISGTENFSLIQGICLEAFDLNVSDLNDLFQRVDFGLQGGDVVRNVSLLAQAVLAEEYLRNHRNDCDDNSPCIE